LEQDVVKPQYFETEGNKGCDLQGRSLDPNHPWNLNLSTAKRKKRLAEIKAYLEQRDRERGEA
jgi:hypothetical protein